MPNLNRHSHPLCPQTASFQLPNGRTPTNLDSPAGPSAPTGRVARRGAIPGVLPRAGVLRAVGAGKRTSFRALFPRENLQASIYETTCRKIVGQALRVFLARAFKPRVRPCGVNNLSTDHGK